MITFTTEMSRQYRNTPFGILVISEYKETIEGLKRFQEKADFEIKKMRLIHASSDRKELIRKDNTLSAYVHYYKKFKKTYHVLPQIESVLNGRSHFSTPGLIQALLLAEITTSLLIAGYDLLSLTLPLCIDVAQEKDHYLSVGGHDVQLKLNDICVKDQHGIVLSIIYGQSEKSRITNNTTDVFFIIDGVPGVSHSVVSAGLAHLRTLLFLLCPEAKIEYYSVINA
ncbi:phenylalanine--tRNA ligase beta subunit-related protein [Brenneria tiliae]|uniref:phenylalanine--tRNA ligase beta subunit-related protein n=1 Tax=Brenneria tiliae TaxID=2914984 RepID=UPI002014AA59|nr:phenylalanine--tRNA ligase beta subunit-related protein [Brenneria tiliae]MCL2897113.1 hypothetical protein [Brenneria tiliae]MCL2904766.1 hypothetical protein [Brenneria tiliae]